MRTRYALLGDTTIEVVIDEDEVAVNILPAIFTSDVNNESSLNVPAPVDSPQQPESGQDTESSPDGSGCQEPPVSMDPETYPPGSEETVAAAQPLVLGAAAPSASVSRLKAANIRGMWAGIFGATAGAAGEGISYAVTNLTTVNLPPGIGLLIGSSLTGILTGVQYWAKKYAKPDGTW